MSEIQVNAIVSQTANSAPTIAGLQYPTAGPLSNRNLVINGNFDVWQRGTTKSYSTTSSQYDTADRWLMRTTGSADVTVSQQSFTAGQTDVPNNPKFFYRWNTTAFTSGQGRVENRIEDVTLTSGQTLTLSFWAKSDAARTIEPRFSQNFGTNGSANVTVSGDVASFNMTTSWQKFTTTVTLGSVNGKTIGTNNCLELRFNFPEAISTTDIAQVQLEIGRKATPFETRTFGDELNRCKRYFSILSPGFEAIRGATGTVYSTANLQSFMQLPPMRAFPTLSDPDGNATVVMSGRTSTFAVSSNWNIVPFIVNNQPNNLLVGFSYNLANNLNVNLPTSQAFLVLTEAVHASAEL